jgi:hypothetical protein
MKNNYLKKSVILVLVLCSVTLFASVSAVWAANSSSPGGQLTGRGYSVTKSVTRNVDYNAFHAISSRNMISTEGAIHWDFVSANSNVGITVVILDPVNYQMLADGLAYSGVMVSNGDYIIDFGTWKPNENQPYYVVFINEDTSAETTSLTMAVYLSTAILLLGLLQCLSLFLQV